MMTLCHQNVLFALLLNVSFRVVSVGGILETNIVRKPNTIYNEFQDDSTNSIAFVQSILFNFFLKIINFIVDTTLKQNCICTIYIFIKRER